MLRFDGIIIITTIIVNVDADAVLIINTGGFVAAMSLTWFGLEPFWS